MAMLEAEVQQIRTKLRLGQVNLVHQREGSLGEIIKRNNPTGDELNLRSLQTQVSVFDLPFSRIFTVDFPDAEFYGERFIELLNQARRRTDLDKRPGSQLLVGGSVNDWRMPDKHDKFPKTDDLYEKHMRGMPKPFKVFDLTDRRNFLYAALPISRLESEDFIQQKLDTLLTTQMADTRMQKAEDGCENALIGVFRIKMSDWNSLQVSAQIPFSSLPQPSKDIIIESARISSLNGYRVIDPEMEPAVLSQDFAGYGQHVPYEVRHLGRGFVEISYGKSKVKYNFRGQWRRVVSSKIADTPDYYMVPRQVWAVSKQTGQRLWLDEDLPDNLNNGVDPRTNIRLGLILAAGLSDERDLLPDRLPLHPRGYEQSLREAQMPLLVYLRKEDLIGMIGMDHPSQIVDPHLTILNGSYFRAVESSV